MASRPRALLATRVFPPDANAAAFRLGAFVEGLERASIDTSVITVRKRTDQPYIDDDFSARIRRWPVLRDAGGNVRGYIQYMSFDVPLAFRLLLQRRHDVWISEAPPTTGCVVAVVASLRRKPFVYYAADIFSDGVAAVGAPRVVVSLMRQLEKWVLRRASAVLSVSPEVSQRLRDLGVRADRVAEVGHGIDTSMFTPAIDPFNVQRPYFIYTGTMSEVHNAAVFVEAFGKVIGEFPEVDLRFFGQGVDVIRLQELADQVAPGRVFFSPVVPGAEVARWIRGAIGALVSLQPGIGYDYAHPTKAYAAAATGTPILFAGPSTFGDIVDTADIGVAVQHDADSVAEAMRQMLRQDGEGTREERREAMLRRAEWAKSHVSIEDVADRAAQAVLSALAHAPRKMDNAARTDVATRKDQA